MTSNQERKLIDKFIKAHDARLAKTQESGDCLVKLIDNNPLIKKILLGMCPSLSMYDLNTYERIGRHQLLPSLLLSNQPGVVKLRTMPYSDQQRYERGPIEVVVPASNGRVGQWEVKLMSVNSMNREQAQQVFAAKHMRSKEEQKSWLAAKDERKRHEAAVSTPLPAGKKAPKKLWEVKGEDVILHGAGVITAKEIVAIYGAILAYRKEQKAKKQLATL